MAEKEEKETKLGTQKKEIHKRKRLAEVDFRHTKTDFDIRQKEWIAKIKVPQDKKKEAEDKLKGVDEWVEEAKALDYPVLPEKVEARKEKLEKEIKKLEKEIREMIKESDDDLIPYVELVNKAQKEVDKITRLVKGLEAYEEELKA